MFKMAEIQRIADQLERAFDGDAWHGDPLMKILEDVTAKQAAAHPIAKAHSIWELVHHIRAYYPAVQVRLTGKARELADNENWLPVTDTSDAAWRNCLSEMRREHREFVAAVQAFPEAKLDENAPNRDHSYYVLLQGMVQHILYHAGQIAILKKAVQ